MFINVCKDQEGYVQSVQLHIESLASNMLVSWLMQLKTQIVLLVKSCKRNQSLTEKQLKSLGQGNYKRS